MEAAEPRGVSLYGATHDWQKWEIGAVEVAGIEVLSTFFVLSRERCWAEKPQTDAELYAARRSDLFNRQFDKPYGD